MSSKLKIYNYLIFSKFNITKIHKISQISNSLEAFLDFGFYIRLGHFKN